VDVLQKLNLTELLTLVNATQLTQLLSDAGNFTIFAPTNKAIDDFVAKYKEHHNAAPDVDFIKSVVLNHAVVGSDLNSTEVVGHKGPIVSGAGGSLFVNVVGNVTVSKIILVLL
jgi:uncharacterized surface protein with fasciclin (FAS1) repeats